MLDIDYCDGQNCSMKTICQRYEDFIFKKEHELDIRYAKNGTSKCEQFKPKAFVGN